MRRLMYRDFPRDLTPSSAAVTWATPARSSSSPCPSSSSPRAGGTQTLVGLVLMLGLHGFITSNVPMGVPLEWNVMMVYGGFFLFWKHAAVSVLSMSAPVAAVVLLMGVVVPFLGNVFPSKIPFLLAMRYYAGNWAYSVWLFKGDSHEKLERLTKSSPWIHDQLGRLYDSAQCVGIVGKVIAFRLMHLHGRVLEKAIPIATGGTSTTTNGSTARSSPAWSSAGTSATATSTARSSFAPSRRSAASRKASCAASWWRPSPSAKSTLHYRIHDAKTGLLEEGHADVRLLRNRHPWGSAA